MRSKHIDRPELFSSESTIEKKEIGPKEEAIIKSILESSLKKASFDMFDKISDKLTEQFIESKNTKTIEIGSDVYKNGKKLGKVKNIFSSSIQVDVDGKDQIFWMEELL